VDAQETVASTGTPQLHITVQAKNGQTGHAYLALTEAAQFGICQLLDAIGMSGKEGETLSFDPKALIDKTCYVRQTQNSNGQLRIRQFMATAPKAPSAPATELE
jgi:hypothetical protein